MTRGAPVPDTVTLHVPFRIVKRGGRKEMHLPDGGRPHRKADSTLVKRWNGFAPARHTMKGSGQRDASPSAFTDQNRGQADSNQ